MNEQTWQGRDDSGMHSLNKHLLRTNSVIGPKGQWNTQGGAGGRQDVPRLCPPLKGFAAPPGTHWVYCSHQLYVWFIVPLVKPLSVQVNTASADVGTTGPKEMLWKVEHRNDTLPRGKG